MAKKPVKKSKAAKRTGPKPRKLTSRSKTAEKPRKSGPSRERSSRERSSRESSFQKTATKSLPVRPSRRGPKTRSSRQPYPLDSLGPHDLLDQAVNEKEFMIEDVEDEDDRDFLVDFEFDEDVGQAVEDNDIEFDDEDELLNDSVVS